jgi:hypothetical protein
MEEEGALSMSAAAAADDPDSSSAHRSSLRAALAERLRTDPFPLPHEEEDDDDDDYDETSSDSSSSDDEDEDGANSNPDDSDEDGANLSDSSDDDGDDDEGSNREEEEGNDDDKDAAIAEQGQQQQQQEGDGKAGIGGGYVKKNRRGVYDYSDGPFPPSLDRPLFPHPPVNPMLRKPRYTNPVAILAVAKPYMHTTEDPVELRALLARLEQRWFLTEEREVLVVVAEDGATAVGDGDDDNDTNDSNEKEKKETNENGNEDNVSENNDNEKNDSENNDGEKDNEKSDNEATKGSAEGGSSVRTKIKLIKKMDAEPYGTQSRGQHAARMIKLREDGLKDRSEVTPAQWRRRWRRTQLDTSHAVFTRFALRHGALLGNAVPAWWMFLLLGVWARVFCTLIPSNIYIFVFCFLLLYHRFTQQQQHQHRIQKDTRNFEASVGVLPNRGRCGCVGPAENSPDHLVAAVAVRGKQWPGRTDATESQGQDDPGCQ